MVGMAFRLETARAGDVDAITALAVRRTVHASPFQISTLFAPGSTLELATTAWDGARLVGFGAVGARSGAPAHQRTVRVYVAQEAEGQGLGSRLFEDCLAAPDSAVTELWTGVFDDDPRSVAIAGHWEFAEVQHTITSRLPLAEGAAAPAEPPDDVGLELRHDFELDGAAAVGFDHLLAVSQTNPEAASSHAFTREELARSLDPGESLLLAIAHVDAVPAAFCLTIVLAGGREGVVAFTGVDPAHRGRGLAGLVKQHAQHAAARADVGLLTTDNEEHNTGIRRINAQMGWEVAFGTYRLKRTVRPSSS